MAVKMNLRIITKRFAADPEIGFLTKSISKANGYGTAMPPAWELKNFQRRKSHIILLYKCIQILKVGNLFYEEICFIFINLVEFYYLFSCDAKNIILNN